jgi:hypothetical protein
VSNNGGPKTYIDSSGRTDDVSDVGDRGTRGSTQIQNLRAWLHVDSLQATEDTSCKLAPADMSSVIE